MVLFAIFGSITIISFILTLLLVIFTIIFKKDIFARTLIICVVILIISLVLTVATEPNATEALYQQALDKNYTVYVNGVEVDPDNIYVNQYKVHIDDEQHKIMLANKK